jgi:hypothetical protein
MGREASVKAEVGAESGEVKAILESQELILRGAIKRRFAKTDMSNVLANEGVLRFSCHGEQVKLHLGTKLAQAWATAIKTPPPGLRTKLGLDTGAKAFLTKPCDDPILAGAIMGAVTHDPAQAAMVIARLDDPDDLGPALKHGLPIWAIYPKGKANPFGDAAIRTALRASGFIDTKSCAVSDRLTATRYNKA